MRVRCYINSAPIEQHGQILDWLIINVGDHDIDWDWTYNPYDNSWYADIQDEELSMIFKLKFGI